MLRGNYNTSRFRSEPLQKKERELEIRKARLSEAEEIRRVVNNYAKDGLVLPRSLADVYENIRDFYVLVDEEGKLRGCAALHIVWQGWAEVRSILVDNELRGRGYGKELVALCLKEAKELGIKKVFALTYLSDFFRKLGFQTEDKAALPHKVWSDCINCPQFPDCNEVAVVYTISPME